MASMTMYNNFINNIINPFLLKNLDVIFLFYGLAFIFLGANIIFRITATKKSEFRLLNILWLLAGFGLTHGINELLDMFAFNRGENLFFQIAGLILLCISYLFLLLFGYRIVNLGKKMIPGIMLFPVLALLFFGLPAIFGASSYQLWNIASRYFLGFTGAILTAIGFVLYYQSESDKLKKFRLRDYFFASALLFGLYGILGGMMVPPAKFFPASILNTAAFLYITGLPVQFFQAFCAVGIAWSVISIMHIFFLEEEAERIQLEEDEVKLIELREVDRMKTEFMSIVPHELRTPLTSIINFVSLLGQDTFGKLTDEQKGFVAKIKLNTAHLQDVVESVLDFTRIESGQKFELKKEPFSVPKEVEEAAEGVKPELEKKEILFKIDLAPNLPTILGDGAKFERVLTNILGNSAKFAPRGGTVELSARANEKEVTFKITDNGIGVPKDQLERIFDKFYQVDSSITREHGGIGMGLTIARQIVEAHGGKIQAESDGPGKGTSIIFTIPIV